MAEKIVQIINNNNNNNNNNDDDDGKIKQSEFTSKNLFKCDG